MFIAHGCQHESAEARRRIRICLDCHRACLDAAGACRGHDGLRAAMPLARALLGDCSQACLIAADFMVRMASLHAEVCGVCAAVCEACAEHCERVEAEVPGIRGCAEACRRCADSCREAASIGYGRAEPGGGGQHNPAPHAREEGHGRTDSQAEAAVGPGAPRRHPDAFR